MDSQKPFALRQKIGLQRSLQASDATTAFPVQWTMEADAADGGVSTEGSP